MGELEEGAVLQVDPEDSAFGVGGLSEGEEAAGLDPASGEDVEVEGCLFGVVELDLGGLGELDGFLLELIGGEGLIGGEAVGERISLLHDSERKVGLVGGREDLCLLELGKKKGDLFFKEVVVD